MRFVAKAIKAVEDTLEANLPAALRAVETEDGIAADSLTDPVAYLRTPTPEDTRAPLVQCYEVGWAWVDQRNEHVIVDAVMSVSWAGTAADLEANADFMRRYIQAMCDVIYDNHTLGAEVEATLLADGDPAAEFTKSKTRYTFAQAMRIVMIGGVRTP